MASDESPRAGKRARPAELPAPARPAALAGAAGQPDGVASGAPGRPAPSALQAAAQSQAARSRRAAARLERTPAPVPWVNIAYQVLRDVQPKRFLTLRGMAECAARHWSKLLAVLRVSSRSSPTCLKYAVKFAFRAPVLHPVGR